MSENVNVSSVYDKDYLDKLLNTVESKFIMLSIEENKTDLESKKNTTRIKNRAMKANSFLLSITITHIIRHLV